MQHRELEVGEDCHQWTYSEVDFAQYNTDLPGKVSQWVLWWHDLMGLLNCFLVGFAASTGANSVLGKVQKFMTGKVRIPLGKPATVVLLILMLVSIDECHSQTWLKTLYRQWAAVQNWSDC